MLKLIHSSKNVKEVKDRNSGILKGEAICLQCKHEWEAVVPIGSSDFLCPKCKTHKGVMKYFIDFRNDSYLKCGGCGNEMFYVLNTSQCQCPMCGLLLLYDKEGVEDV